VRLDIAYLAVTIVFAAMVTFSGIMKIRRDEHVVRVIHEVVGVPMQYFSILAACEFVGAAGLVLGIWWPLLGIAAAIGLILYFVGAVLSHLRVGDAKGMGPAAFMFVAAMVALAFRLHLGPHPHWYRF